MLASDKLALRNVVADVVAAAKGTLSEETVQLFLRQIGKLAIVVKKHVISYLHLLIIITSCYMCHLSFAVTSLSLCFSLTALNSSD